MKISIQEVKEAPAHLGGGLCVFGKPSPEVQAWIDFHGLNTEGSGKFTNILVPKDIDPWDLFSVPEPYEFVDGFSPNLNKRLHLGHLSNLVLAKTFQAMGMGKKFIAILGDTLDGEVSKQESLATYLRYSAQYGYLVDQIFFASEMRYEGDLLVDGTGEFEGTKVFRVGDRQVVGIKSDGSTSYFYQDMAMAQELNGSTLYLTGFEQNEHFADLEALVPHVDHCGLGLVTLNGKKQSTREGNVIYAQEVLDDLFAVFPDDHLVYNVLAGLILKSSPKSTKDIDLKMIKNPRTSHGLYLSYTMARLRSAGVQPKDYDRFFNFSLGLKTIRAQTTKAPNILLEALVEMCKEINRLYLTHRIEGNPENKAMFSVYLADLQRGMNLLGMFSVSKV